MFEDAASNVHFSIGYIINDFVGVKYYII